MDDLEIPLRLVVVAPPTGVVFALQRGRDELCQVTRSSGAELSFDLTVRVRSADGNVRILGPFSQGPPASRFFYLCSGTLAGDFGSRWTRRAKIPFRGITPQLVEELERTPGAVLEVRIAGTGRDGGPACASVPLLEPGWRVVS